MAEFLNFQDISSRIPFPALLNHLNIPYTEKKNELKGKTEEFDFIINTEKNLFFCPQDDNIKGSVINFYSQYEACDLRSAAKWLKDTFLNEPREPKREIPTLDLDYSHKAVEKMGIGPELAEEFEVGYCSQKSIMAGKIAFKVINHYNEHTGYIGYDPKKQGWFFPKNFKRDTIYNLYRQKRDAVIVVPDPFDVLYLAQKGYFFVVALMAKSATDAQLELLKGFKRILLFHPEPDNIANRLRPYCFIKSPVLPQPIKSMTTEQIRELF